MSDAPGRLQAPAPLDPAWSAPEERPGDDHAVPLRVVDGVVLVVWSLLGQLLVVLGVLLAGVDLESGPTPVLVGLLAQSVVLAGALAWFAGRSRLTWRLFGSVRPSARLWLVGLGVGLVGILLSGGVILVLGLLVELEPPDQQLLQEALAGGLAAPLAAVSAVLMAPLIEEFIFRGVLFQALGRRLGVAPAAVLSGVIFAAVHVELGPPYLLALALLGILFAYAFHRTGSLLVPVVGHATFNGVQLALALTVS